VADRRVDERAMNDRRDDRVVDYRYAGNGTQPSAAPNGGDRFESERFESDRVAADRIAAEQRDAEALRRQRAYQIGREDAHAQRPDYSETYRR
jgi:hypothetical protein